MVSGGVSDLSGDTAGTLRTPNLISTAFPAVQQAFDVAFTLLEGAEGVGIETFGNAYINGSEVRFLQGYGGAAIVFGTDAFAPGLDQIDAISTSAVVDWGGGGQFAEPLAISFGDQASVLGAYGTALGSGLTASLDPGDSSYAISWNGQQISSGSVGFDLVNVSRGTYGMSVSEAGEITLTGPSSTIATVSIPGEAWANADRSGWELGYASQNNTGIGWMYGRDFEVSGSGS